MEGRRREHRYDEIHLTDEVPPWFSAPDAADDTTDDAANNAAYEYDFWSPEKQYEEPPPLEDMDVGQ